MAVAPFLSKTFDLVTDTDTNPIVSWTPDGTSFVVWKTAEFAKSLLPKHFKHNNFSSFVRQLNTYGFKKIDPDRWEFANPNFQRDRPDLMTSIQRRKGQTKDHQPSNALIASGQSAIEVGQYGGLMEEVESLKRDKNVLMMELVHLRQQQQKSDINLSSVKKRLDHTEKRLSEVIAFFSRVASNPTVLAQMVTAAQQSQAYLAEADARRKKRRADGDEDTGSHAQGGQLIPYKPVDVASFFQNLLVSPYPEPDVQEPDAVADGLEDHFNSIDLASGPETVPMPAGDRFTIQEHTSSAEAGGDESNGEGEADLDIQVPSELAGGIPNIGLTSVTGPSVPVVPASLQPTGSQAEVANGNAMAAPAVSSGVQAQGVFAQPEVAPFAAGSDATPADGTRATMSNPFSGSIPLPDPNMQLDEILPADLLLDGSISEMFKGGMSLGDLPEFKEEPWNPMDEEFNMPPAAT